MIQTDANFIANIRDTYVITGSLGNIIQLNNIMSDVQQTFSLSQKLVTSTFWITQGERRLWIKLAPKGRRWFIQTEINHQPAEEYEVIDPKNYQAVLGGLKDDIFHFLRSEEESELKVIEDVFVVTYSSSHIGIRNEVFTDKDEAVQSVHDYMMDALRQSSVIKIEKDVTNHVYTVSTAEDTTEIMIQSSTIKKGGN